MVRGSLAKNAVLALPGKVVWLEVISQLFATLILLLPALFALLPVGSSWDVQDCLTCQDLPADTGQAQDQQRNPQTLKGDFYLGRKFGSILEMVNGF